MRTPAPQISFYHGYTLSGHYSWLWLTVGIVDVIMFSVKRHRFFPPERFDDLEHLFKLLNARFRWRKVIAVGQVFVVFLARSDTQDESSPAQIVQRDAHPG